MNNKIVVKMVVRDDILIPTFAYDSDAGMDIRAAEAIVVKADGTPHAWETGIRMEIPEGWYAEIVGRSSMGLQGVGTMTGIIDSGYRGEVKVVLYSIDGKEHRISRGAKIAQMLYHERPSVKIDMVHESELSESERGTGGFGSTGK